MTHCSCRWGLSAFFKPPPDRVVTCTLDDLQFHDMLFQQFEGPARPPLRRLATSQRNQLRFGSPVENTRPNRGRRIFVRQGRIQAVLYEPLACPKYRVGAGVQRLRDPAVGPSITGIGNVRL